MSAPPLAPELWNCGAVIVIVGMCGWAVRLLRLGHKLVEMRYAVRQEAVRWLRAVESGVSCSSTRTDSTFVWCLCCRNRPFTCETSAQGANHHQPIMSKEATT